jgi:Lon protease-like protein
VTCCAPKSTAGAPSSRPPEPKLTELELFPLANGLFPDGRLTLQIFEVRYLDLIKQCQRDQRPFGVVMLHQGSEVQQAGVIETPGTWGCLAHLESVEQIQPALLRVSCRGGQRFRLTQTERGPYGRWRGQPQWLEADAAVAIPPALQPLADRLGHLIADAQRRGMEAMLPIASPYRLDEAGWVANRWAELLPLAVPFKEHVLAMEDPLQRLQQVAQVVKSSLAQGDDRPDTPTDAE